MVNDWRLLGCQHLGDLGEVLAGYVLAIVVSIPLAAVLAQFRVVENALYPTLVASQTIPKVAIAPILVVWFGFGLAPKILIAFLICFFPIVVDTLDGTSLGPAGGLWLARSMGASQWKTFMKIRFPPRCRIFSPGSRWRARSRWSARWWASSSLPTAGSATS